MLNVVRNVQMHGAAKQVTNLVMNMQMHGAAAGFEPR